MNELDDEYICMMMTTSEQDMISFTKVCDAYFCSSTCNTREIFIYIENQIKTTLHVERIST